MGRPQVGAHSNAAELRGEGFLAHGVRGLRWLGSRCRRCHEDLPHVQCHDGLAHAVGGAKDLSHVQCHDGLSHAVGGATRTYLMAQCHDGLAHGVGGATRHHSVLQSAAAL